MGCAKWLNTAITVLLAITIAATDKVRQEDISKFIKSREGQSLMCLYTFDRIRAPVNISAEVSNSAGIDGDAMLVTVPLSFEEHIGAGCPFGDLQLDPELVRRLSGSPSEGKALGVHLSEDLKKNAKRPQIASNDVVAAKSFFAEAVSGTSGYTFEFVYRRRQMENHSMTLFSVGNLFGECTDPGFRLDVDGSQALLLIYSIPEVKDRMIRCVEQRVYSAPCTLPTYRLRADDNPAVHVTVTIKAMKHRFFVKYVDPVTMKAWECDSTAYADMMNASTAIDYIRGTYRLFIGNNPRNVSTPLSRPKLAAARSYRDPEIDDLSPEERLRAMIQRKIDSIQGPRLPASLRVFGGKALSLQVLGLPFAPINEDSPFAWIRDQITTFKREHTSDIVAFVMNSLRDDNTTMISKTRENSTRESYGSTFPENASVIKPVYPDADPSVFDLFHFAIYETSLNSSTVKRMNWAKKMTPFRPFMDLEETIHIKEDEEAILDMMHLHSVFDDIQLEIIDVPQFGQLLSFPDRWQITKSKLIDYSHLPIGQQREIIFVPDRHQNNKNIPFQGAFGFIREFEPYAVIRYRIWRTTTGRSFNPQRERVVNIFVDSVLKPLQPKGRTTHISLTGLRQVELDLSNVVGASHSRHVSSGLGYPEGKVNPDRDEDKSPDATAMTNLLERQVIRIVKFPRYGRIYDRTMVNTSYPTLTINADELDAYRIHRDWIANRTFSPSLLYVPDEHFQRDSNSSLDVVQFQLGTNDSKLFSEPASVFFIFPAIESTIGGGNDTHRQCTTITTIQLKEETGLGLALSEYEPLWGHLRRSVSFRVVQLPQHGKLYQFDETATNREQESVAGINSLITEKNAVINNPDGKLVYVPNVNYFNTYPPGANRATERAQIPLDDFTFEIVGSSNPHQLRSNTSSLTHEVIVSCASAPRRIQLQVVNAPDDMVILPPTTLEVLARREEHVAVPVLFDDPDSLSASYRAILDGSDDISDFSIGDGISQEVVLRYCPRKGSCRLNGSVKTNPSDYTEGNGKDVVTHHFQYIVDARAWRSSELTIEGSKVAMQVALANLTIRAHKMLHRDSDQTAKFRVKIEKLDTVRGATIEMSYYIDFLSTQMSHGSTDSFSQSLSNLIDVVSVIIWIALVGFVLSSACCCSMSFCCCCSRARSHKRQDLENGYRRFQAQVVQNDFEYSSLLEAMWGIFCDDTFSVSLWILCVRAQSTEQRRRQLQSFAWRSMKPLLVAANLEYQFVTRLVSVELHESMMTNCEEANTLSGLVDDVMASLFGTQMSDWMIGMFSAVKSMHQTGAMPTSLEIVDAIELNVPKLPVQLTQLCRVCSALLSPPSQKLKRVGAHHVFFNHFVAPACCYARRNSLCTDSEAKAIEEFANVILRGFRKEEVSSEDVMTLARYNCVLDRILETPVVAVKQAPQEIDFDLLNWCLMNLHCVLEALLPEIEKLGQDRRQPDVGTVECRIKHELPHRSLHKLKLILPTLSFPFSRVDILLSLCEVTPLGETRSSCGSECNTHRHYLEGEEPGRIQLRAERSQKGASLLSLDVADEEEAPAAASLDARLGALKF